MTSEQEKILLDLSKKVESIELYLKGDADHGIQGAFRTLESHGERISRIEQTHATCPVLVAQQRRSFQAGLLGGGFGVGGIIGWAVYWITQNFPF